MYSTDTHNIKADRYQISPKFNHRHIERAKGRRERRSGFPSFNFKKSENLLFPLKVHPSFSADLLSQTTRTNELLSPIENLEYLSESNIADLTMWTCESVAKLVGFTYRNHYASIAHSFSERKWSITCKRLCERHFPYYHAPSNIKPSLDKRPHFKIWERRKPSTTTIKQKTILEMHVLLPTNTGFLFKEIWYVICSFAV